MSNTVLASKVVVVGAGLMGCGIAQVFAQHQIPTVICDPVDQAREKAEDNIRSNLRMQGLDETCLSHIRVTESFKNEVEKADFVIEAAPEKLPIKQRIFSELVACAHPDTILASNTSVIPIGDISAGLDTADRIIGTHWWNPPYLVPLVEVVQSERSSEASVKAMIHLLEGVGKKPIHVKKDVTGFVANRMQHALWREAIALVNEGVCDAETIDVAVKNSFGLRLPILGPIENADLVGLDLTQDIHNVVLKDLNRDQVPSPILEQKIAAGEVGMKSGEGLRRWTPERAEAVKENLIQYLLQVTSNPFPHSDS